MYPLKALIVPAMALFSPIITSSVSIRMYVDGMQETFANKLQDQSSSSLDLFDCGSSDDAFQLSRLSVSPDPPQRSVIASFY